MALVFCNRAISQGNPVNYSVVDWQVQNIAAPTTDSLAKKISSLFTTDKEKVRAIFTWVATNISYNTGIFTKRFSATSRFIDDYSDTASVWKSADEMVADRVFKRRVAVCDGYARLFKTLCTYAGIKSEIIYGYVNGDGGRMGERFRTNHTWNAVFVDSAWHLIDVTWASGYVNYGLQFVHHFQDYYFFTSPKQLIKDHYPEDPRWTLLDNSPEFQDFKRGPFKSKAFVKYGIENFSPSNGIIAGFVGDTVNIELQLYDVKRAKTIAPSTLYDSLPSLPSFPALEPVLEKGNKVVYTYVIESPQKSLIQLVYNKDIIMQYRLQVKEKIEVALN
ncbi:MAG TPA: transglutaminase domain-containing protein [Flavisolibacter sp.]|nr:transglutaminase domain-containing protein [Flavisolibacter sp.]